MESEAMHIAVDGPVKEDKLLTSTKKPEFEVKWIPRLQNFSN